MLETEVDQPAREETEPTLNARRALDRLSVIAAVITILTFMRDIGDATDLVLRHPGRSVGLGLCLATLFVGDLLPQMKIVLRKTLARFGGGIPANASKTYGRNILKPIKVGLVAFALLLVMVGGLALATHGVFYVMLESRPNEAALLGRADELNTILARVAPDLYVTVLPPKRGTKDFAISMGPYLSRRAAEEDLERLRRVLGNQVRNGAWVSRTTLITMNTTVKRWLE